MKAGISTDGNKRSRQGAQSSSGAFGAALRGARFANAVAERGTARADIRRTQLIRRPDGRLVLRGTKYYSTGVLTADWIGVQALNTERPSG